MYRDEYAPKDTVYFGQNLLGPTATPTGTTVNWSLNQPAVYTSASTISGVGTNV